MTESKEIEVGYESVVIHKLFGPTIYAKLRITANPDSTSWIIERQTFLPSCDANEPDSTDAIWVEWCSIPAQFRWEFPQHD